MPAPPKSQRPTLRRLAIFDAVIRTGSAGAAAQDIGLSQPAVTHALDKLESEVGGRLFDRGPGGSESVARPSSLLLYRPHDGQNNCGEGSRRCGAVT